jgi:hypothetical protein
MILECRKMSSGKEKGILRSSAMNGSGYMVGATNSDSGLITP